MIVLELPGRKQLRLEDAEARSLADLLWELARRAGGTAMLAAEIEEELQRQDLIRRPVEVSVGAAERLTEALAELN